MTLHTLPDLQPIISLARAAGKETLRFYGQDLQVDLKADNSPLTQADLASHHLILEHLREFCVGIPVVSEEDVDRDDMDMISARRFWLVDPLDGTKEFVKRTGTFTVNIGLIENGQPVAGVIHVPARNETYWGSIGNGAWKQSGDAAPQPISCVEPPERLRFVASRDHAGPEVAALLSRFPDSECLSIGSSLKFCLVAEGAADAYLRDVPTMEWDTAAAQAIVEAAGGAVLTHPNHQPLCYGKPAWRNGALLTVGRRELAATLVGAK